MRVGFEGFCYHVVNINLRISTDLWAKYGIHCLLKRNTYVDKIKRHVFEAENPSVGDERHFFTSLHYSFWFGYSLRRCPWMRVTHGLPWSLLADGYWEGDKNLLGMPYLNLSTRLTITISHRSFLPKLHLRSTSKNLLGIPYLNLTVAWSPTTSSMPNWYMKLHFQVCNGCYRLERSYCCLS